MIQYKFSLKDLGSFLLLADHNAVTFGKEMVMEYTYFDVPHRNDEKYITLRIKDKPSERSIDVKIRNQNSHEYEHHEVKIDNAAQARDILIALGCKPIVTFHKTRRTWENDFIRLDIDTTPELGSFLEVKFLPENKEKAHSFLSQLGVDPLAADNRSSIQIYLEKVNEK